MPEKVRITDTLGGTAFWLSIVFPGLGHIYLGRFSKGILFYLLAFLVVTYPFIWIISLVDIVYFRKTVDQHEDKTSKRRNIALMSVFAAPFSLAFLITLSIGAFSLFNDSFLAKKRTEKETIVIKEAIIEYEIYYGRYPDSLDELISIRPIRKGWMKDYWNRGYNYSSNDSEFVLISSGKDRKFNTDDDIKRGVNISN